MVECAVHVHHSHLLFSSLSDWFCACPHFYSYLYFDCVKGCRCTTESKWEETLLKTQLCTCGNIHDDMAPLRGTTLIHWYNFNIVTILKQDVEFHFDILLSLKIFSLALPSFWTLLGLFYPLCASSFQYTLGYQIINSRIIHLACTSFWIPVNWMLNHCREVSFFFFWLELICVMYVCVVWTKNEHWEATNPWGRSHLCSVWKWCN